MLDFTHSGTEERQGNAFAAIPERSRLLGLNATVPPIGYWALAQIDPEVPKCVTILRDDVPLMAEFALVAHEQGLKLPEGEFSGVTDSLEAQLSSAFESQPPGPGILGLDVNWAFKDRSVFLTVAPQSSLRGFTIGPTVKRLESMQAGLGYGLLNLIGAGHAIGLALYDPTRIWENATHWLYCCESTDREFFEHMGGEESEGKTFEEWLEQAPLLPSQTSKCLWGSEAPYPLALSSEQILQWVGNAASDCVDLKVLRDALTFHSATQDCIEAIQRCRSIKMDWDDEQPGHDYFVGNEPIGGSALLVWNDPDYEYAFEVIEHYERYVMECDDSSHYSLVLQADIDNKPETAAFIHATQAFGRAAQALNVVIGHFQEIT